MYSNSYNHVLTGGVQYSCASPFLSICNLYTLHITWKFTWPIAEQSHCVVLCYIYYYVTEPSVFPDIILCEVPCDVTEFLLYGCMWEEVSGRVLQLVWRLCIKQYILCAVWFFLASYYYILNTIYIYLYTTFPAMYPCESHAIYALLLLYY